MASSAGHVTIVCPICHREVTLDLLLLPELHASEDGTVMLGKLTLDTEAVYAHLLSHGPHDGGEPMPKAA